MSEQEPTSVTPNNSPIDELRELLPSYALGTLTPAEHLRVQQLLEQYPEMEVELDAYLALSEGFLLNIEPVQPSPSLRSRLLDQLAAEEASLHASHDGSIKPVATTASDTHAAQTATHLKPLPKPSTITQTARRVEPDTQPSVPSSSSALTAAPTTLPSRPVSRIGWMLAAACLALLLVTNVYWFSTNNNLRTEVQNLQSEEQALVENLLSDSSHEVVLVAAEVDDDRIATIFWNEATQQATILGAGLPQIEPDQVYQLWLLNGNTPVSAGIFGPDIRETFSNFPANMAGYTAVALTVEPEGGSDAPTTTPFAIAELS
jgi:anti-sigma-K factor RskA